MSLVRVALELIGVAAFFVLQYLLLLVYELAAGLRGIHEPLFWSALVLGHVAMLALLGVWRRVFAHSSAREVLDAWLAAFLAAATVTLLAVHVEWPFGLSTGGGHGLAGGGEANAVFMPWLHGGLWVVLGRRKERRAAVAAEAGATG